MNNKNSKFNFVIVYAIIYLNLFVALYFSDGIETSASNVNAKILTPEEKRINRSK